MMLNNSIHNSWLGNMFIYYDNVSLYYIGSILISFISVFLTWWFHRGSKQLSRVDKLRESDTEIENADDLERDASRQIKGDETMEEEKPGLLTELKMARQTAIVEQLVGGHLTEQQIQEEREAEANQLQSIFQLLQNQEEKFHVGSMEELQEQMKLYRK